MIQTEFEKGNSKLKPVKIGNKVYCIVQALTGKGLHSKCKVFNIYRQQKCFETSPTRLV